MRNLTVRFERTKLVKLGNTDAYDVYDVSPSTYDDTGELIRADGKGFYKYGKEVPIPEISDGDGPEWTHFVSTSESSHGVSGRCVSLIEYVAAFSCGAVVSWEWWNKPLPERAEVVGNVVRTLYKPCVFHKIIDRTECLFTYAFSVSLKISTLSICNPPWFPLRIQVTSISSGRRIGYHGTEPRRGAAAACDPTAKSDSHDAGVRSDRRGRRGCFPGRW